MMMMMMMYKSSHQPLLTLYVDERSRLPTVWSRLVKFCTPCLVNNVVVASLKDLEKDDHLLIFHQVEGAFFEVERIMN